MGILEVQEAYNKLCDEYDYFIDKGDITSKPALARFRDKFCSVLRYLNDARPEILDYKISRDDKAMTPIKAAIAVELNKKEKSWSKCETKAAASEEYHDKMKERRSYYKGLAVVDGMINTCNQYINSIARRQD